MTKKSLIKLKNKYRVQIYFVCIIVLAFYLRVFTIDWDSSYYFHPDERAIVMFAIPLHFPENLMELFSAKSPLNPHFFAYGNFPLYLLRLSAEAASLINPVYKIYGGIHIIGRLISAFADTGTVIFIFLIGSILFSKRSGLFGALLYSLSVLPIQLAHFYAVDPLLTFFITGFVYMLLEFISKPTIRISMFAGSFLGLALATKVSAAIMMPAIFLAAIISYRLQKMRINTLILFTIIIIGTAAVLFIATQPYVLIDFSSFLDQVVQQSQMSKNPFLFPYTLQYVGKVDYLYELKNIFLWGQGPLIFLLNFLGLVISGYLLMKRVLKKTGRIIFLLTIPLGYFLVFGSFAVGWMRYMLPIYPFLSIFGGFFISEVIISRIPKNYYSTHIFRKLTLIAFILLLLIYPVSFLSIYTHPNTRIQASDWINSHIPYGKTLAIEHWDDALPVYGGEKYVQLTLPLYDPDTKSKWQAINSSLDLSDYIIIASSRLYIPLQKLTDCNHLPANRCYPITATYYKKLLAGQTKFKKIKEFTSQPTIPILNIKIDDFNSDENFTVFDHPKIMIFKKE